MDTNGKIAELFVMTAGLQHDGETLCLMGDRALKDTPTIYRGTRPGSKGGKGSMSTLDAPPHPPAGSAQSALES